MWHFFDLVARGPFFAPAYRRHRYALRPICCYAFVCSFQPVFVFKCLRAAFPTIFDCENCISVFKMTEPFYG